MEGISQRCPRRDGASGTKFPAQMPLNGDALLGARRAVSALSVLSHLSLKTPYGEEERRGRVGEQLPKVRGCKGPGQTSYPCL